MPDQIEDAARTWDAYVRAPALGVNVHTATE
jgi:hypothetical protein